MLLPEDGLASERILDIIISVYMEVSYLFVLVTEA